MAESIDQYRQLLQLFDKAGVPRDMRWRSLLLFLREIKDYSNISDIQKITVQELLAAIFASRDYSEENLHRMLAAYQDCMVAPYRKKTESMLQELAGMVREFQKLLSARSGDLDTLEETAVSIVEDVFSTADKPYRLHESFARVKELLADDIRSLENLAASDALTGIANRRAFDEFMEKAVQAWRDMGRPLRLAMLDIDFFKHFNDEHGHRIGDQVLVVVAKQLTRGARSLVRPGDVLVARYGGEEFVMVVSGDEASRLPEVVEQVRQSIKQFNFLIRDADGNVVESGLHITVSAGIAAASPEWRGAWLENITDCADKALYYAKSNGRDLAVEYVNGEEPAFRIVKLSAQVRKFQTGITEDDACMLTGDCPLPQARQPERRRAAHTS
ncbi:MAG: GGDEF domain-containing protein [Desulfovibrio sp.]|jgi:diguanylate cyclase (GGDEF)-like protein|nr:GGDEF domain-containing protein [Desulfovibrio sp.]